MTTPLLEAHDRRHTRSTIFESLSVGLVRPHLGLDFWARAQRHHQSPPKPFPRLPLPTKAAMPPRRQRATRPPELCACIESLIHFTSPPVGRALRRAECTPADRTPKSRMPIGEFHARGLPSSPSAPPSVVSRQQFSTIDKIRTRRRFAYKRDETRGGSV